MKEIDPFERKEVSFKDDVRTYVREVKSCSNVESILRSTSNESSNVESILRSKGNDNKDNKYSSKIVGTYDGNSAYNDQKQ